MYLWWGPSLEFFYNDGCIPILGGRHPEALGRDGRDVWPEVWEVIRSSVVPVLEGRASGWSKHVVVPGNGDRTSAGFALTLSCSPLLGERGAVEGVVCGCFNRASAGGPAEAEVKALFARLITIQEDERRRIARDIHDQAGQQVTALRLSLESLASQAIGDPTLLTYAARAQRFAEELDDTVDFLTYDLRPVELQRSGLASALDSLVRRWSLRFRIAANFESDCGDDLRFPTAVEANIYRLVQEALHNVFKHARAERVTVFFGRLGDHALLIVEDDGCGFTPSAAVASSGLGLEGMRERASLVGAELQIESAPGEGTSVRVRVPLALADSGLA
jgi:signal transduction histidine kinase